MAQEQQLLKTRRFRVVRLTTAGRDGQEQSREIVRHPGAVVILPLADDGRVGLIRNRRAAVGGELIELPAGTLEPDENPEKAAHRELAEETGFRAGSMELLTSFYSSPGILDEQMHLYLATGLEAGPPSPEPDEQIQLLLTPWDEAVQMARDGRIRDAKTLAGLLYYHTFRRRL